MQIHQLVRINKNKKSRSVGRGGKRGKTSGRGTKGQKARAGAKLRPEIRDIIKKLPKLRGYSFKSINEKPCIVCLKDIETHFSDNDVVNVGSLIKKGILGLKKGRNPRVKILSDGEITKKIIIDGCSVSLKAKEKIEKVGGEIKI